MPGSAAAAALSSVPICLRAVITAAIWLMSWVPVATIPASSPFSTSAASW
jgi:hypothetical protein